LLLAQTAPIRRLTVRISLADANPSAFFDVTVGTNAIPRGVGTLKYGFACAPGWDAATGLGTPHFDKMLAAALKGS